MSLHFAFRKIPATPALKEHIEKKVERFEKFVSYPMDVHVIISLEKTSHVCEITCHAEHRDLFAIAKTENLYESIQVCVQKLETQLKKERERRKGHQAAGKVKRTSTPIAEELPHAEKRVRTPR